jgi:twinfilin-like protein
MSHSSGIPVSKSLSDTFGAALTSEQTRFVKAQIVNDEIVPTASCPIGGDYEEDLDKIPSYLDPTDPCYILFRLDEKNAHGNLWVMMCYVPDKAKVREKMTYASSRSNLKKQLGGTYFSSEIFGTVGGDFNKQGYKAFVAMQKSETPLTWTERQSIQEKEQGVYVGGTSTAYIHGVAFPVEADATQALKALLGGQHNYVQLAIDDKSERIVLDHSGNIDIDSLGGKIPTNDQPRFHFFRYDHNHEGEDLQSIVMIFSCPDGSGNTKSAPVKLRMLYSSSKANIENILSNLGGKTEVKMEVNNGSEVTKDSILAILHPQKEEEKKAFAKPKGPSKSGKRLIRNTEK